MRYIMLLCVDPEGETYGPEEDDTVEWVAEMDRRKVRILPAESQIPLRMRLVFLNATPDPGCSRLPRVFGEIPRWPRQSSLEAVGDVSIAAVEDFGKEKIHEPDELRWHILFGEQSRVLPGRDLGEPNLAPGGSGDLVDRLGERHQSRTG